MHDYYENPEIILAKLLIWGFIALMVAEVSGSKNRSTHPEPLRLNH